MLFVLFDLLSYQKQVCLFLAKDIVTIHKLLISIFIYHHFVLKKKEPTQICKVYDRIIDLSFFHLILLIFVHIFSHHYLLDKDYSSNLHFRAHMINDAQVNKFRKYFKIAFSFLLACINDELAFFYRSMQTNIYRSRLTLANCSKHSNTTYTHLMIEKERERVKKSRTNNDEW